MSLLKLLTIDFGIITLNIMLRICTDTFVHNSLNVYTRLNINIEKEDSLMYLCTHR